MYVPELYLALIIGAWLIDSAAKKRRKAHKRAAKVAAYTPHVTTSAPAKTRLVDHDFVVIGSLFGMSAALLWLVATFGG